MTSALDLTTEDIERIRAEEAETDDGDGDDGDNGDGTEPEAQVIDAAKVTGQLEREYARHNKRLGEILGPGFADFTECPTCAEQMPGFVLNLPDPLDSFLIAPDKAACPECDGWGFTKTGSRHAEHLAEPCGKCSGNGWIVKAREEPVTVAPTMSLPQPAQAASVPVYGQDHDQWGRPPGHPHYWLHPAQVPVS